MDGSSSEELRHQWDFDQGCLSSVLLRNLESGPEAGEVVLIRMGEFSLPSMSQVLDPGGLSRTMTNRVFGRRPGD
jgi:hypothetical protein